MDDTAFESNFSFKRLTLQLSLTETTFEVTFTCVIFTIAFFGAIGNLAAIGKIIYDPKYHTPTFAAIGQLALADFLSVIVFSFVSLTNIFRIWWFIIFILNTALASSYFHVCLLSAVRFLITVYPLQSQQHLTVTGVCLCSVTVWITSGVAGFVFYKFWTSYTSFLSQICIIIIDVVILLTVCLIMILFHVRKIRTLQNSLSVTDQSQRRMNIVVTVIVGIFVLLQLSKLSAKILFMSYFKLSSYELLYSAKYLLNCVTFIGCLNFSCNPYILFLSQFI